MSLHTVHESHLRRPVRRGIEAGRRGSAPGASLAATAMAWLKRIDFHPEALCVEHFVFPGCHGVAGIESRGRSPRHAAAKDSR